MDDTAQNQQSQGQSVLAQQQQPSGASRHPEQGPLSSPEAAPIDVSDVSNVSDQLPTQPEATIGEQEVQETHPLMEIPPALSEAGVERGPDADFPEDQLTNTQAGDSPDTATAAPQIVLPMTRDEAAKIKKQSRFRDFFLHQAVRWLAALVERQWKKLQMQEKRA